MSLNTYDSSSGTLTNIASSSRIWTGTKAEWNALVQAGTAPRNVLVAITDDEQAPSSTVEEGDENAVQGGAVYDFFNNRKEVTVTISSPIAFKFNDVTETAYLYKLYENDSHEFYFFDFTSGGITPTAAPDPGAVQFIISDYYIRNVNCSFFQSGNTACFVKTMHANSTNGGYTVYLSGMSASLNSFTFRGMGICYKAKS